jgi:hypothetical protein
MPLTKIKNEKIKIDAFNFGNSFRIIVTHTEPNTMESGNSALVGIAESFFAHVSIRLLVFKFIGLNSK